MIPTASHVADLEAANRRLAADLKRAESERDAALRQARALADRVKLNDRQAELGRQLLANCPGHCDATIPDPKYRGRELKVAR